MNENEQGNLTRKLKDYATRYPSKAAFMKAIEGTRNLQRKDPFGFGSDIMPGGATFLDFLEADDDFSDWREGERDLARRVREGASPDFSDWREGERDLAKRLREGGPPSMESY